MEFLRQILEVKNIFVTIEADQMLCIMVTHASCIENCFNYELNV